MAVRGDLLDPEHMGRGRSSQHIVGARGRVVAEDKEEREMSPPPRSRQRHSPNQLHVSSRSQQASLYLTFRSPLARNQDASPNSQRTALSAR